MRDPLVSVLTPSYGYGRFIEDALRSVQRQAPLRCEHIVQDAESRDETVEVLSRYDGEVDWRSEPDNGQSDALNKALSRANGEWVSWLNADEFYLPQSLPILLRAGIETGADIVYGDAIFVDESGSFVRLVPQHQFSKKVLRWYDPFISSCATLFRREVLGQSPWDTTCRGIMDFDLYLRLTDEGRRFVHVPVPVGIFRVHGARVTAQPGSLFAQERLIVAQRYDLPKESIVPLGRCYHGFLKFIEGAYFRQLRARVFRGSDLRWFLGEHQERAVGALVSRTYRSPDGNENSGPS